MTRVHGRVDANQAEITEALRTIGAFVVDIHEIGGGVPDLLVGYRGAWYLMEVKSPGGKLTPDERQFRDAAARQDCQVMVVWNAEDAMMQLRILA